MKFSLSVFPFVTCAFGVPSNKSSPNPGHEDLLFYFLLRVV